VSSRRAINSSDTNKPKLFHGHPPSCSHSSPAGGLGAFVGRHGGMNPAGKIRGRENMMPAYIGQPAGHEKGSATTLSPAAICYVLA
jgi:hypothetical protein